jgi:predicted dinucleotide-binding enzyme
MKRVGSKCNLLQASYPITLDPRRDERPRFNTVWMLRNAFLLHLATLLWTTVTTFAHLSAGQEPFPRKGCVMDDVKLTRRDFVRASAILFAAGLSLPLARATASERGRALRIGIIGSGQMGGGLGRLWASAGHQVFFSSRNPPELAALTTSIGPLAQAGLPAEAATFGEVVLIAVPYGALPQIGQDYGPLMQGKIVIDCGNPRDDRDGPMANDAIARGTGIASAGYLPGVRLVRAFNAISAVMLDRDAHREPPRVGIPIAGDDPEAVQVVSGLVVDAGFDPVVVGPLARAREFDRGTPVYVRGMTAVQLREALGL